MPPGSYVLVTALSEAKIKERREANIPLPAKVLLLTALVIVTMGSVPRMKVSPNPTYPPSIPPCESNRVTFEAKAGHIYRVDGDFVDGICWLWVEDVNTGEIVAGIKATPAKSTTDQKRR